MLTYGAKKIVYTMTATQPSTARDHEGVDAILIAIQEEYLENAPRVN